MCLCQGISLGLWSKIDILVLKDDFHQLIVLGRGAVGIFFGQHTIDSFHQIGSGGEKILENKRINIESMPSQDSITRLMDLS